MLTVPPNPKPPRWMARTAEPAWTANLLLFLVDQSPTHGNEVDHAVFERTYPPRRSRHRQRQSAETRVAGMGETPRRVEKTIIKIKFYPGESEFVETLAPESQETICAAKAMPEGSRFRAVDVSDLETGYVFIIVEPGEENDPQPPQSVYFQINDRKNTRRQPTAKS